MSDQVVTPFRLSNKRKLNVTEIKLYIKYTCYTNIYFIFLFSLLLECLNISQYFEKPKMDKYNFKRLMNNFRTTVVYRNILVMIDTLVHL